MKMLFKKTLTIGTLGVASLAVVGATISCGVAPHGQKGNTWTAGLVIEKGEIMDKSFNEQAVRALMEIRGVTDFNKLPKDTYLQSIDLYNPDIKKIVASYAEMADKGNDTIIAAGWGHVDPIKKWNEMYPTSNEKFILIDNELQAKNVASVVFDAKQPSFMAGYVSAKYLSENYSDNADERKLGLFGGDNTDAVKDFLIGYVQGVQYWNEHDGSQKPVKFADFNESTTEGSMAYLKWQFEESSSKTAAKELLDNGAKVILPVAGAGVKGVLEAINETTGSKTKVIGVDVDQAKIYSSDQDKFLTSILKKVKESILMTYKYVANYMGQTVHGNLENHLVGLSEIKNTSIKGDNLSDLGYKTLAMPSSAIYRQAELLSDSFTWDDAFKYIQAHK